MFHNGETLGSLRMCGFCIAVVAILTASPSSADSLHPDVTASPPFLNAAPAQGTSAPSDSISPTIQVNRAFRVSHWEIQSPSRALSFSVCAEDLVFVAVDGGVAIAGSDAWLVPRRDPSVVALDCAPEGDLFFVIGKELLQVQGGIRGGKRKRLTILPNTGFNVAYGGDSGLLVWGQDKTGAWVVERLEGDGNVFGPARKPVFRSSTPITAMMAFASGGAIFASGRDLYLWDGRTTPRAIAVVDDTIDGIGAIAHRGLFVSTPGGVLLFEPKSKQPVQVVTGAHGPLRILGQDVYVLASELDAVLKLAPIASTLSPPSGSGATPPASPQ